MTMSTRSKNSHRRNVRGMFRVEDTETRKQESLGAKDRGEAKSLLRLGTIFTLGFF